MKNADRRLWLVRARIPCSFARCLRSHLRLLSDFWYGYPVVVRFACPLRDWFLGVEKRPMRYAHAPFAFHQRWLKYRQPFLSSREEGFAWRVLLVPARAAWRLPSKFGWSPTNRERLFSISDLSQFYYTTVSGFVKIWVLFFHNFLQTFSVSGTRHQKRAQMPQTAATRWTEWKKGEPCWFSSPRRTEVVWRCANITVKLISAIFYSPQQHPLAGSFRTQKCKTILPPRPTITICRAGEERVTELARSNGFVLWTILVRFDNRSGRTE